ncbi:hypothetical protein A2819_02825 [Candidatus Azambacteria bacterium RIFCSPHIGHO2_01_FULL_40_24]|uniref:Translation elongation factor-like protein n=1 Tax=Candidatus Azambacteria bacterium RIFCSPHIGHO2_01_FULL_40_24 TaxID=1797301 RepID=A0A1F5B213_9BACT|nr:MAG: hypothetical protein A2819_02825 [Candidatus Azambacteria bacterium RIFCSPHIGHO2_01_FULL_40_24]OGY51151.1 MAG: hypothetical protein A3B89_04640 [Candidatus Buchananbacteria bacterium RIFCSPHIGHO2_02_FULL_40_13]
MKKVGTVTHYYGNISVAIVALAGKLSKGDKVKFESGKTEFEQTVESMQIEHKEIDSAKKGDIVGMKVDEKVSEGADVYLMEE